MIKLRQLLTERVVNLFSKDDRSKYLNIVWSLLEKSYAKIGGFKGAANKNALLNETYFWKLIRLDNEIVAGCIYKDIHGRKAVAGFSNGTDTGKKALYFIWLEDIKLSRAWAEVSGATEHIQLKLGEKPIPNKYVSAIIDKDIISLNPDGYHYTRLIAGEPHEKILIGTVQGYNFS